MSEMGIAQKLLRGSSNIDLMKKEARNLVSMVMGTVSITDGFNKLDQHPNGYHQVFRDDRVEWHVRLNRREDRGPRFEVECFLITSPHSKLQAFTTEGALCLDTETAQRVYESLDVFVQGMRETFPSVEKNLQPFLEAAEKKL